MKNFKEFKQSLQAFDKSQYVEPFAFQSTSLRAKFYDLGKKVKSIQSFSWWRKIAITCVILVVEILILLQLSPIENKFLHELFSLFVVFTMTFGLFFRTSNPLEEAYRRRRKFAQQLLDTLPETYARYSREQQQNQERREQVINCSDPLTYYLKGDDFIEFMQPEQIEQYWKEKRLPRILSEIDKSDTYIEKSIARVNEEQKILESIVNS